MYIEIVRCLVSMQSECKTLPHFRSTSFFDLICKLIIYHRYHFQSRMQQKNHQQLAKDVHSDLPTEFFKKKNGFDLSFGRMKTKKKRTTNENESKK